jgi:hypothetical protein
MHVRIDDQVVHRSPTENPVISKLEVVDSKYICGLHRVVGILSFFGRRLTMECKSLQSCFDIISLDYNIMHRSNESLIFKM